MSYVSRSLGDVESLYFQKVREALTVRWAVEYFHFYVFDKDFTVVPDHKPIVSVFPNVLPKPSRLIERWCVRFQQYTFKVVYRTGANNLADYMSRHPIPPSCTYGRRLTEEYIYYVCDTPCPKAISPRNVIRATEEDYML